MSSAAAANIRKNCGIKEPRVVITRAWFVSLVFVTVTFFLACSAAYTLRHETYDQTIAFMLMWTVLLLVGVSISGTVIMRRFPTDMAIGGFLGVIIIMSQQMLILFAMFVDNAYNGTNQTDGAVEMYKACAGFFFMLFAIYSVFCILLGSFKNVIVTEDTTHFDSVVAGGRSDDAEFDDMPPINI